MLHVTKNEVSRTNLIELIKDRKNNIKIKELIKDNSEQILAYCDDVVHLAAKYNCTPLVEFFVESGCELNIENSSGMTPLMIAAMNETEDRCSVAKIFYRARVRTTVKKLFSESGRPSLNSLRKGHFIVVRKVVSKLKEMGVNINKTGELLAKIGCPRETLVKFQNRRLTDAYMQTFSPYDFEDINPDNHAFRIVMKSADWRHLDVILRHFSDVSLVSLKVFKLLMEFICHYDKSKAGRDFIRGLLRLNIFNKRSIHSLEMALVRADSESLKVFLKYNFRSVVMDKIGIDIMPSLFGNPNVKATSLLKNKEIDINALGTCARTPLHYAASFNAVDNISWLLERNANMYAVDEVGRTPVSDVIARWNSKEKADEECIKLFLLAGANPLVIKEKQYPIFTFFGIEKKDIDKSTNVIHLLAAHLAICEALGLSIERFMKGFIRFDDSQLEIFFNECRRQLELMKTHEVRKLTMFSIISEKADKIARCIGEEDRLTIESYMKEYRETKILSYYRIVLENRIKSIDEIHLCKKKAMSVISECTGINAEHLIIYKIVNYLDTKDLFNFK